MKMRSSFNGYIDEIPFINIDNFENKYKSAYFLSHFHGDHVVGLKDKNFPSKLKENSAFIYASEITIAIVKSHYPELEPFLRILELGRNAVTITINDEDVYLSVIALPAGHCLGSTMFLFQYKYTILYSGDIRITPNTLMKLTHLHKDGDPIEIDVLYVDTTFQDVPSFPKRPDVMRNVATYVSNWLKEDARNMVVLETSAQYGYEYICNYIFNETGLKTYISDEKKWNLFCQFPNQLHGVTNDPASRIKMYSKYEANFIRNRLANRNQSRTKKSETSNMDQIENIDMSSSNILVIKFSALKWREKNIDEDFIEIVNRNRIDVCFSLHCDRKELLFFVNYLRPKKVVGFPDDFIGTTVPVPAVPVPAVPVPPVPEVPVPAVPVPAVPVPKTEDVLEISLLNRKRSKTNECSSDNKKICNELQQSMFGWN